MTWPTDSPKEDHLCTVHLFGCFFPSLGTKEWGGVAEKIEVKKEAHDKLSSIFERSESGSMFKDQTQCGHEKPNPDSTARSQSSPSRDPEPRNSSGGRGWTPWNIQWNLRKTVAKQHY